MVKLLPFAAGGPHFEPWSRHYDFRNWVSPDLKDSLVQLKVSRNSFPFK